MPLTSTVDTLSRAVQPEGTMAEVRLGIRPDFAMPAKRAIRFPRSARLLRRADFERVYREGRRHFSASMTVFYWPRPHTDPEVVAGRRAVTAAAPAQGDSAPHGLRVGFTVGRALGGAVQRNRMKRRLREAVRRSRPATEIAADVVINPKKSVLTVDFTALLNEVSRAFAVVEQKLSQKIRADAAIKQIAGSRKSEAESQP